MHCSMVSPCVIHPGNAGTVTVYPPSSVSGSRIMVYFGIIMFSLSHYKGPTLRATQKSSVCCCQEMTSRATARVPTAPLHCPRPYNDGDSRERVERLLRSPERAIEGALLRSSTGIASDRYV